MANAAQNASSPGLFPDPPARRADAPRRRWKRTARSPVVSLAWATVAGNHLMSQSILVTGGAGYVGSHACKALAGAGYRPVVYDNLSRGHREAVRWGPFVEGDLHDKDRLAEAMRVYKIEAVMHFAAFAYVGESVGDPEIYY